MRVNGAEVPFSVSDYQEYNEAMLEVALPSDREIELTMDYGGFPRENRNVSIMQGGTEISSEYLCLENAGLSPRLINVLPGENGYPTTIEITLPASMSVIPFGASKAEVVAEQTDGTKTWRYDSNSAGGILYAGDYIRQDIQAGGMDIEFYYGRKHQAVMEAAGAAEAVRAVMDYWRRALRFSCLRGWGAPQADPEPGGRAAATPGTGPACWTRPTSPPTTWATRARAAGPPR